MALERVVGRTFVPRMAAPALLAGFQPASERVKEVHLAILPDRRETAVVADGNLVFGIDEP